MCLSLLSKVFDVDVNVGVCPYALMRGQCYCVTKPDKILGTKVVFLC